MSAVSVVIPTYNRGHLIAAAIDSLLAQTRPPDEIVVVDDSRTSDDTEAIVKAYGDSVVRYCVQRESGISKARNLGILRSTGDYLLFLDSDDVLMPTALERMSEALDDNPDYGACYCGFIVTSGPGELYESSPLGRPSGDVLALMCREQLCLHHSALIRRECLASCGLFDPRLRHFDDIDFWIRASAVTRFLFLPEHLVEYRRWHPGASALDDNVWEAGGLVLDKLCPYYSDGRLSKDDWEKTAYRFRGHFKDIWVALAFQAYGDKEWRRAYRYALRGPVHYPRALLNRGYWAVAVKSFIRSRVTVRS